MKKSILLDNRIKVKTNIWILITCIYLYLHVHSVNLACVLNLLNVIFRDFKISQFCQNAWCVVFYGQYTIGFLNSINVLGDKILNPILDLDRCLPLNPLVILFT